MNFCFEMWLTKNERNTMSCDTSVDSRFFMSGRFTKITDAFSSTFSYFKSHESFDVALPYIRHAMDTRENVFDYK